MDWARPLQLWNDDEIKKHFPFHGPYNIKFEDVRAISIISNFTDNVKNSTLSWFPCDTEEMWEDKK